MPDYLVVMKDGRRFHVSAPTAEAAQRYVIQTTQSAKIAKVETEQRDIQSTERENVNR